MMTMNGTGVVDIVVVGSRNGIHGAPREVDIHVVLLKTHDTPKVVVPEAVLAGQTCSVVGDGTHETRSVVVVGNVPVAVPARCWDGVSSEVASDDDDGNEMVVVVDLCSEDDHDGPRCNSDVAAAVHAGVVDTPQLPAVAAVHHLLVDPHHPRAFPDEEDDGTVAAAAAAVPIVLREVVGGTGGNPHHVACNADVAVDVVVKGEVMILIQPCVTLVMLPCLMKQEMMTMRRIASSKWRLKHQGTVLLDFRPQLCLHDHHHDRDRRLDLLLSPPSRLKVDDTWHTSRPSWRLSNHYHHCFFPLCVSALLVLPRSFLLVSSSSLYNTRYL
jgi:hypothetical protein